MKIQKSQTRRLTTAALFLAFSVLLPMVFHLTGIPNVGQVLLPMHIPVLLCGFCLGPYYGAAIGVLAPVINCLLTAMPSPDRLPFMVLELCAYGLTAGLLMKLSCFRSHSFMLYPALLLTMLTGRGIYALSLLLAGSVFGLAQFGAAAALTATVKGMYGIVLQFIVVPPLVLLLKRTDIVDRS